MNRDFFSTIPRYSFHISAALDPFVIFWRPWQGIERRSHVSARACAGLDS
jgi:hypothetical protein